MYPIKNGKLIRNLSFS